MLTVHFTMKSLPLLDTGQIGFSFALGQWDNDIISDADLEPLTFQCFFLGLGSISPFYSVSSRSSPLMCNIVDAATLEGRLC